jgi:sortase A
VSKASKEVNSAITALSDGSQSQKHGWKVWDWIQNALFTAGLSLLAIYGAVRLEGHLSSRAALNSFVTSEPSSSSATPVREEDSNSPEAEFSGWNEKRIHAYKESFTNQFGAPMAVLQIPKIRLAVPLLDGTDDLTLNHAVGHIAGTARPGGQGNIGIAGHRDGFFRGLKDVKVGDAVELRTAKGTDKYVVDQILIVKPDNVGVLRSRPLPSLTLVTCYPFYFIGSAPKRYVVMASLNREISGGPGSSIPGSEIQPNSTNKEDK